DHRGGQALPPADRCLDPGERGRPVRPGPGHARVRPSARPVRVRAGPGARRDRARHPGRVRAGRDPGRPVRRPAYHAGRGPADGGGDRGVAGPAISGALAQSLGLAVPLLATAAIFAVITAGLALLRVLPGPAAPY